MCYVSCYHVNTKAEMSLAHLYFLLFHDRLQSAEDLAGSRPLTAQDVPTIVQAVLDALPSRIPVPLQSSHAEVAPSPGTSRDDVPTIGQLPPPSQITHIS